MSFSRLRRGREDEGQDGGRGGGEGSTPAKWPRGCSCSCCISHQETKDFYEAQIEILKKEMRCMSKGFNKKRKRYQREMQSFYQNSQLQFMEEISEKMGQLIREQLNSLVPEISTPGGHVRENSNLRALSLQREVRICRLKFENSCCKDKHSGHVIEADDGNAVKVAIYDHCNRIITDGPLSSVQVKIVVVEGEFNKENKEQWSEDSFLKNTFEGRPGKPPLFANDLYLRLKNGVASLRDAKFQDNIPGKKFRLGVMAADDRISERVQEGISDSFTIRAGRGFFIKKDAIPSLSDPISKLKKIAGVRQKKLEQMQIHHVEDFLRFYNKDKKSLRKACGTISDQDWNILVEHALSCKPEFNGKYASYEELSDCQKGLLEVSKTNAYYNWDVTQYGDKDPSRENEVITGENGSCYLLGSCSVQPFPTQPTKFHDDSSHQSDALGSAPALGSPRLGQRWVKIVTLVAMTVLFQKKKKKQQPQESAGEMPSTTLTGSCLGRACVSGTSLVAPETSDTTEVDWLMFLNLDELP